MPRVAEPIRVNARVAIPPAEVALSYARSGGPGGQHVNKTATKVLLRWNLDDSAALGDADRAWLRRRLASRLTAAGDVLVAVESHRDQKRNVEEAIERFRDLLARALERPKRRKKTRPTRASKERRLDAKRRRGETKRTRREPPA